MKREENGLALASSSSHRGNETKENRKMKAKAVGCMSALFHFLNSRKFKRLTLGKTEEEKKEIFRSGGEKNSRRKRKSSVSKRSNNKRSNDESSSPLSLFSSCADPRSPALPTELRRSEPALVARLMGLDGGAPAAEKRRILVEALERCDRDLKALKSIINAVRSGEDDNGRSDLADEPSPVSVLLNNFLASPSPFAPLRSSLPCYSYGYEKKQQQFIVRQQKKKPEENEFFRNTNIFDKITCESLQRKPPARIADIISHNYDTNNNITEAKLRDSRVMTSEISHPPWKNIKTTKEVVEEVFGDIAWGQKREIGRIGIALQDHIFRDMVEEIVMEFGYSFNHRRMYSLPFEACKRRLSF